MSFTIRDAVYLTIFCLEVYLSRIKSVIVDFFLEKKTEY